MFEQQGGNSGSAQSTAAGAPQDGSSDLDAVQLAQAAPAGEPIGAVAELLGSVTITRTDGSSLTAAPGSPVYLDDVVTTGSGSSVEIEFVDGTRFSLGQDGQMTLDTLVYDPAGSSNELDLSVAQGAFTFVTGAIAGAPGEGMEVRVPVGTIGIRGTAVGGGPDTETADTTDYTIVLLPEEGGRVGRIVLTDLFGRSVVLDDALEAMDISSLGLAPGEPVQLTREQVIALLGLSVENIEDILNEIENFQPEESPEDDVNPEAGPQQEGQLLDTTPNTGGIYTLAGRSLSLGEITSLFTLGDEEGFGGPLGGFVPTGGLGNEGNEGGFGGAPEGSDGPVDTFDPSLVDDGDETPEFLTLTGDDGDNVLDASGFAGPTIITGNGGQDTLIGSDFGDILNGGGGSDNISGGAGIDTAVFAGNFADYQIQGAEGGFLVIGPDEVTDFVSSDVEFLSFDDQTIATDDLGNEPGEATEGSAIKTSVTVGAGAVLTFRFNFLDSEPASQEPSFKDFAVLFINGQAFKLADVDDATQPIGSTAGVVIDQFNDQTGYGTFTLTFTQGGTFSLGIAVMNEGDTVYDAGLLVDDVSITGGAFDNGFETGLNGWQSIGNVGVRGAVGGVSPAEGEQQALLVSNGATPSQIEDFLGIPDGTLEDVANQEVASGNIEYDNTGPSELVDANGDDNIISVDADNGTAVQITAQASDPDAGDTLTYSLTDDAEGLFEIDPATGIVTLVEGGTLSGLAGSQLSITVRATDEGGLFTEEDFTIVVTSDNQDPVAQDDAGEGLVTEEGEPLTFHADDLLGNDSDPDDDSLFISNVFGAVGGTVSLGVENLITFTPTPGYIGEASFQYTVSDGEGGEDTATVTLLITAPGGATEGDDFLTGTENADVIDALGGNDFVSGLGGGDELIGGQGNDTVSYVDASFGVAVDLEEGEATNDGEGTVDTLSGFENVIGSSLGDSISGDSGANVLFGGFGFDTLEGRGGDDFLYGGEGGDIIDGGDGNDTVVYTSETENGVIVDLSEGTAVDEYGFADQLISIENVMGTEFADEIIGNDENNTFYGVGGADDIDGGNGDDTFVILDTDEFNSDAIFDGGEGGDTLLFAGEDLDISLAGNGVFINFENVDIGGTGANTLTLSANDVFNSFDEFVTVLGDEDDTVILDGPGWQESDIGGGFTYYVNTISEVTAVIENSVIVQLNSGA